MAFGTESLDASLIPISSVYSKENNTFPALVAEPGAYQDANSNQSSAPVMSFLRPLIVQKAHNVTGSGGKTLTCAFTNNNIAGNSIIVCVGLGEVENGSTITLAITDTLGNTYAEAVNAAQSTTLEAAIFYATNIAAGTNTITVTIAGGSSSNTAIAVQIYEVFGLITAPGALDTTATGSNAGSTAVSTGAVQPSTPNELAFVAIATAGGTITPGNNWTNDTGGTLSPTGGGLGSFEAQSRLHTQIATLTPSATISGSNAWAAAIATFKSVIVPVQGVVTSIVQTTPVFTTAQSAVGSSNSGDLDVSRLREISIDINTTAQAGTSPTIQFFWDRKGADGVYYPVWQSAVLTAASNTLSTSVGPGLAYNQSLGTIGRLRWNVGGSATPTWTFSPNVYGK